MSIMRMVALVAAVAACAVGCDKKTTDPGSDGVASAFVYMTDYQSAALGTFTPGDSAVHVLPLGGLHTDVALTSEGGRVYVIERFGKDGVIVLDADSPEVPLANYSVGNGTNPQDLVLDTDGTRAYVTRLHTPNLLVVDAASGDSVGTVDLSAYADADGAPEMSDIVHDDDGVAVLLQRLDTSGPWWSPADAGLVVKLTGGSVAYGVTLTIQNPEAMIGTDGTLYVVGGAWGDPATTGIDRVDMGARTATRITEGSALRGHPAKIAKVDGANRAWVVVAQAWPMGAVYQIDLATGAVTDSLAGVVSPSGIAIDDENRLIVCDRNADAPALFVFDAVTGERVQGPIDTPLPPDLVVMVDGD